MSPLSQLFRRITTAAPNAIKNYYFVDKNLIIGYREKQLAATGFREFIENPNNSFMYTETVLSELNAPNVDYPESNPEKRFRFVDSRSKHVDKDKVVGLLHRLWDKEFQNQPKNSPFGLTGHQLEKFKKDLFIVFEAGYACYAPGVLPDDDFREAPLLTNNMKLVTKFLKSEEIKALLETTINLSGLEHLISVQLIEEVLRNQASLLKPSPK